MKDVPAVKWPMPLADLNHPERWPMRGRSDHGEGMPSEAQPTPSADTPAPEEVPGEQQQELPEADDRGSE